MSSPRRRTRRYDQESPRRVIVRGALVLAIVGVLLYLAAASYNGVPGRSYRYVDAVVPELGSLIRHDPVRIGGVRVGQVASIDAAPRGEARIHMQIEPGTKIPADTKILIRANGLLGARIIELHPGRAPDIRDGQVLRGDDNSLTYGVVDALDVLDRETRGGLKSTLGELGRGLEGRGQDVNDTLRYGGQNIAAVSELFGYLDRNARGPLERLLPAIQRGNLPFDATRTQLAQLFGVSDRALQPFVREGDALQATLREAPSTLGTAEPALRTARPLLRSARVLSHEVRVTLPPAPAALRATRALLIEARTPLQRATKLLAAVPPTVPQVLKLTRSLRPLLAPASKLLDDSGHVLHVIAPYGCDVTNFGAVFRSMTGLGKRGPGGPAGPAMEFRLQAVSPLPAELLSQPDTSGLLRREGVGTPCQYPSTPYPIVDKPQALLGGRKR
jgi:phospholipid/cholesterol/gamma-HCH transport system substrate-binding protein